MKRDLPDFFPLIPGLILEYEVEWAQGQGAIVFDVLSTDVGPALTRAACRRRETRGGETTERSFEVAKDARWVRAAGDKHLPRVPKVGEGWDVPPFSFKVGTLDASTAVPAGEFRGCLRIDYLVAAGDAGGGSRLYAPGIGLVYEECSEESDPFESRLARYRIPSA